MAERPAMQPRPFPEAVRHLARERAPALLLGVEGIILFANEAWGRFARENGGGERVAPTALVGTRWLDHVSGEGPRRLHGLLLDRALRRLGPGPGGAVVQFNEANGPDRARLVATHLEPVAGPLGEVGGVAIIHRTVRELPIAEVYAVVDGEEDGRWRDATGAVEQCSCCRRVRRPDAGEEWDFVPGLVAEPPAGTRFVHCPLCLELHYPGGAGVEREEA